jgi:alpha-tubulin suppressor-like RCC1 family protein
MYLDCRSLIRFSAVTQSIHRLFDQDELTELLRVKIQLLTELDLTSYTREQLTLLFRVITRRFSIGGGNRHLMILTSRNQVLSLGDNQLGQLGLGDDITSAPTPTWNRYLDNIIQISVGEYHTLALNDQGQATSCGSDRYGQLGLSVWYNGGTYGHHRCNPETIEKVGYVTKIAAGAYHSLILNASGDIFGFGHNNFGQLGLGDNVNRPLPVPIIVDGDLELLGSITILAAGGYHSLIGNSDGQVFSFGANDSGQLGLGNRTDQTGPCLIKGTNKIIALSAGMFHSLILDREGQVFGFGCNESGELGLGLRERFEIPTLIEFDRSVKPSIIAIAAGGFHSLFLDHQGQVFSCGSNGCSQLGLKGYRTAISPSEPTVLGDRTNRYYPTLISLPEKIILISTGSYLSLLVDEKKQIFPSGAMGGFGTAWSLEVKGKKSLFDT